jgi:hypothetical protein
VTFRVGEDRIEEVRLSNFLRVEKILFVEKPFDTELTEPLKVVSF